MTVRAARVAFVGDAHLLPGDDATQAFVGFIEGAHLRFDRLVLVGDIFDLWLARPHLQDQHHVRVLDALTAARGRGLRVDYVVGNRDYAVETCGSAAFDSVASEVLLDAGPDAGWAAEHGDLVNDRDRQYRAWRRLSRSRLVLGGFLALPGSIGRPLSLALERRMRTTNLAYKRAFPAEIARSHAAATFARTGARHLVLGHFHQELRLEAPGGEILVLPDWKRARRHAVFEAGPGGGVMRFESSA